VAVDIDDQRVGTLVVVRVLTARAGTIGFDIRNIAGLGRASGFTFVEFGKGGFPNGRGRVKR
jgi:hypothetical protein